MNIITKIFDQPKTPMVGDKVWWATKGVGCLITEIFPKDNSLVFQGGPIVETSNGRQVPRWTVASTLGDLAWRPDLGMWIASPGPTPKNVRGLIITPDPVQLSGKAQGSFARRD